MTLVDEYNAKQDIYVERVIKKGRSGKVKIETSKRYRSEGEDDALQGVPSPGSATPKRSKREKTGGAQDQKSSPARESGQTKVTTFTRAPKEQAKEKEEVRHVEPPEAAAVTASPAARSPEKVKYIQSEEKGVKVK